MKQPEIFLVPPEGGLEQQFFFKTKEIKIISPRNIFTSVSLRETN